MEAVVEFLKRYQLDAMLVISGICLALAVLAVFTNTLSKHRRRVLVIMELAAAALLLCDRLAYLYRGDISELGFFMTRASNFAVYFLQLFIVHQLTLYLYDLYRYDGNLPRMPRRLGVAEGIFVCGLFSLIISQFTDFYYYFDSFNRYHRAPGFPVCYAFPFSMFMLQMSVIIQYRKYLRNRITLSLIFFTVIPFISAILQIFVYGISLINITLVGMVIVLYTYALLDLTDTVARANDLKLNLMKEEQERVSKMFEQTAEALAGAIDAKDAYTHGHSARVAEYSVKIAREAGKTEEEIQQLYFSALLHDVGKIGIPDTIINKDGKLTEEEFAVIKQHPVIGKQILSSISESPYLSIAANYHHERYDGQGYPDGLRDEDIPEIARIVAVADAYDAMTSRRSYRDPIPQHQVREEIVKGIGTQFDPRFAKIMLHLLDLDTEYQMKENEEIRDLSGKNELYCGEYRKDYSDGMIVNGNRLSLRIISETDDGSEDPRYIPTVVLYDALDERVHVDDALTKKMCYFEYAAIRLDGEVTVEGARKYEKKITDIPGTPEEGYGIDAVRYADHIMMHIRRGKKLTEIILALPDSVRFSYLSLTGEHCLIRNVAIDRDETEIGEDAIPRIAEEISFIDAPEGDVPNIQINGWRAASTVGVPVTDGMTITFHTLSLPTARLIWHCPFVSIYSSDDGQVDGPNYHEYVLVRLDGETWESDEHAENRILIDRTEKFENWDVWKQQNKEGMDCTVSIKYRKNVVKVMTENGGIAIKSTTVINDEHPALYVSLTGDQCAITNVRFSQ